MSIKESARQETLKHFGYKPDVNYQDGEYVESDHFGLTFAARNREAGFIAGVKSLLPVLEEARLCYMFEVTKRKRDAQYAFDQLVKEIEQL